MNINVRKIVVLLFLKHGYSLSDKVTNRPQGVTSYLASTKLMRS